jgi:hypothetical protein
MSGVSPVRRLVDLRDTYLRGQPHSQSVKPRGLSEGKSSQLYASILRE